MQVKDESDHRCTGVAPSRAPHLVIGTREFSPDETVDLDVAQISGDKQGNPDDTVDLRAHEFEDTFDMKFHVEKQQDPMIGGTISERYRVLSLLGRGGMGVVYKGEQINIDRVVAIKMLPPHLVADAEALKRFKAEAQAISLVEHPHSVRIYDFGVTEQGQPYLVMDFLDGISLRDTLRKDGPLSIKRACDIFEQVIAAVGCAHKSGVVHRDLKPENIMLGEKSNRSDWVSVVDFGISNLAAIPTGFDGVPQPMEMRGSPPYMSPEQCTRGATVDPRSDIYSLAVVLFECLSGRLPYNARGASSMLEAHRSGQPLKLNMASDATAACDAVTSVIAKALEKRPDKRYTSIEEFGSEFIEAAKKDNIRANYLVNRKSLASGEQRTPAQQSEADSITENLDVNDPRLMALAAEAARPKYSHCPRCNEPLQSEAAFCLACGRSLAASQEFAKIRAASGVFMFPKSESASHMGLREITSKSRELASSSLSIKTRLLLAFALISLLALGWFGWHMITESKHGSEGAGSPVSGNP